MKKLTITSIIMLILICITTGNVFAVYQSSPNSTAVTKIATTWMSDVRKMEATAEVMGLNESLGSLLVSTESNNIDVHLQKNTEYGAMLILAVSEYGKQGNGIDGSDHINDSTYGLATTTGNVSGIYNIGTAYEWVAGGGSNLFTASSYDARYYNLYTSSKVGFIGDAMIETAKWQNSPVGEWMGSRMWGFYRGAGGPFSYNMKYYASLTMPSSLVYYARACIVNGEGF